MKNFLVDTNVILRLLLKDNKAQYQKVEEIIVKAENNLIKLELISQIVFETVFVLKSFYGLKHQEIVELVLPIVQSKTVIVDKRQELIKSLKLFEKTNISLVDCFLHVCAKEGGSEVLSFDKDFKKLEKLSKLVEKTS